MIRSRQSPDRPESNGLGRWYPFRAGAQATIKAKLQSDSAINGVLTLGPVIGKAAIQALGDSGSDAKLATFDLNADVTKAIADGDMLFAVDQQQYVQGYLPIVMLTSTSRTSTRSVAGSPSSPVPGTSPRTTPTRCRTWRPRALANQPERGGGPQAAASVAPCDPDGGDAHDRYDAEALDERIAKVGLLRRLLLKPELGSLIGAVVIFVFFATQSRVFWQASGVANWLDPASTYGIMAVVVALLMIGGHFDLSAGVQLGTAGLTTAILTTEYNMVVWVAMLVSLRSAWGSASSTATWSCAPVCQASSSRSRPS